LASTTGASASFIGRDEFLTSDVRADVIMVVNTLHHIPFSDIPRQLFGLFAALREGGVVLVHEMGELRHPEQMNVPWRAEDLWKLFDGPRFTMNPRTTQSRSGVPLSNVLVEARGSLSEYRDALDANARTVWMQIKRRVLDDVRRLYGSRDEHAHAELQHALIINANLDLNPPREWNDAVHQHGHHR
jgi:hypothetical protein